MRPENYSLKYQSLGAGLQSSTITEMIVEGILPPVDIVIFADTGDEPDYVYEQVEYLKGRLETVNLPLVMVSAGNIIEDTYRHGRFASMPLFTRRLIPVEGFGKQDFREHIGRLKRQCTKDYKIVPIEKWIKKRLLEMGLAKQNKKGAILPSKGVKVQCQLGISFDEIDRMKPSQAKWVDNAWPLIDRKMKRLDCEEWLKSRNLPIPKKSSCRKCPFHTKTYLRDMQDNRPDDWQGNLKFDCDLRNGVIRLPVMLKGELFMTEDCIPLSQVDLSTEQENGQLDMCDEGYCFI